MHVPILLLIALAGPLALAVSMWIANRPERNPDLAPGETELEFGFRDQVTFALSREYLPEFLYELRSRFENGWTLGHVSNVLVKVVDRRADWEVRHLVTAAGTADELSMRFCQADRDVILCCVEAPRVFASIVRRVAAGYPGKALG